MLIRPIGAAILAASLITRGACRQEVVRLDAVQKMAYGVKPAVVRVNAYATAQFRYSAKTIRMVESALRQSGIKVVARELPVEEAATETGAGGSGSGFIVNPNGIIVTNGHVVGPTRDKAALEQDLRRNGAIAALVRHFPVDQLRELYRDEELEPVIGALAGAGRIENMATITEVELSNGEKLPFTIESYSPSLSESGSDLAVLRVKGRNLPTIRLGDSESVGIGESVWAIGYPAVASSTDEVIGGWLSRESDLEATFNPGTITAIKRNKANAPVFQSNVAIYRGNSGGPAVNRAGEVIAIATWGHTTAEQIKFLVPVNDAKAILRDSGIAVNVTGEFDRNYGEALEAAEEGDWRSAKKSLAAASGMFRNSPDVIRFQRDAERALAGRPSALSLAGQIAGAGALVVMLAVTIFVLVRSRAPRIPRDPPNRPETLVAPGGAATPGNTVLGRLTILNGERAGQKLGLGGSGIRIGRESAICEIVLENPKVSRLHAEVVSIDGKVLLIDRNSSNGTYVNDQKIDRRFLKDGDIIHFGGRNAIAVAFHA